MNEPDSYKNLSSEVDDATLLFMEKTMDRVNKMRKDTEMNKEKKKLLRASLSDSEKEKVFETMKEVQLDPVSQHLDHSALLQEQVKIRNAKFS